MEIQIEDVERVAKSLNITITEEIKQEILNDYPSYSKDSVENWSFIVEDMIYEKQPKRTAKYFKINGYWKDNKSEFNDYVIQDTHDVNEEDDDNIFFYGLNENDIKQAIAEGKNSAEEFVITEYKEIKW